MKIFDKDGIYKNIPVVFCDGFSSLAGLTEDQAEEQFGRAIVTQAILDFQNVKISKLTLIDRLEHAGLFVKTMKIIKSNDLMYERWQASSSVNSSNKDVRKLLAAIGGDLDVLLASEE